MRVAGPAPGVIALQIGGAQDLDRKAEPQRSGRHTPTRMSGPSSCGRSSREDLGRETPCGPQILLQPRSRVCLTRTIEQPQHIGGMVSDEQYRVAEPQGRPRRTVIRTGCPRRARPPSRPARRSPPGGRARAPAAATNRKIRCARGLDAGACAACRGRQNRNASPHW